MVFSLRLYTPVMKFLTKLKQSPENHFFVKPPRNFFQNDYVALRRAKFLLVLVNNEMQPAWGPPIIFLSATTSGSIIRGQFTIMGGLVISLNVPSFSTKELTSRCSIGLQQGGAWWHVEEKVFSSQVLRENVKVTVIRCSRLLLKPKILNLSNFCA